MPVADDLAAWRGLVTRLRQGPAPRGEAFDLCRRIVALAPSSSEAVHAVRTLLEGAMADASTPITDAQETMRALRALDRGEVRPNELLPA